MRPKSPAEERTARPRLRKVAESTLVVLIILLPALLAFGFDRIDTPPGEAEIARVKEAVFPDESKLSESLLMFYGSTTPESVVPRWDEDKAKITMTARLAGMLAMFAISALLYLLLLTVRGRATAVFGCLGLCLLPPVVEEGYVLRSEQCATLFGMLGVLLIAGFPLMQNERSAGWRPRLIALSLMVVVGLTFGIARASHQGAWIYLTIPAMALLLAVMTVALMFPRATRGVSFAYWPFRAAARRYVPWMLMVLVTFALTLGVLVQNGDRWIPQGSKTEVGLLPDDPWVCVAVLVFAFIGGLRLVFGVSVRVTRLRRVRPDTVLFLYVASMMMQHALLREDLDRLPVAIAVACLVGDGVMTAAVLGLGRIVKRRAAMRRGG